MGWSLIQDLSLYFNSSLCSIAFSYPMPFYWDFKFYEDWDRTPHLMTLYIPDLPHLYLVANMLAIERSGEAIYTINSPLRGWLEEPKDIPPNGGSVVPSSYMKDKITTKSRVFWRWMKFSCLILILSSLTKVFSFSYMGIEKGTMYYPPNPTNYWIIFT